MISLDKDEAYDQFRGGFIEWYTSKFKDYPHEDEIIEAYASHIEEKLKVEMAKQKRNTAKPLLIDPKFNKTILYHLLMEEGLISCPKSDFLSIFTSKPITVNFKGTQIDLVQLFKILKSMDKELEESDTKENWQKSQLSSIAKCFTIQGNPIGYNSLKSENSKSSYRRLGQKLKNFKKYLFTV